MSENPNPLPVSTCPTCHYKTEAATCMATGDCHPSEGDYSVCMKYGEILIFNAALVLRAATVSDMLAASPENHRQLTVAQNMIRRLRPLGV